MKNSKYINHKTYTVLHSSLKKRVRVHYSIPSSLLRAVSRSAVAAFTLVLKGAIYCTPSPMPQELHKRGIKL